MIALLMFSSMMLMLLTGQRVFGAIGFVAAMAALFLWGEGGSEMAFSAAMKLMKWYPLLTLPMFIYMGYMLSESKIADDLYHMFHVWMGPLHGGLAIGTIGLMVVISAMNGLSVAGMAIGATIALPELLRRGYDKVMVTGVILPLLIIFAMTGLFLMGVTSLVESSAVGAVAATVAALVKKRLNRQVMEEVIRKTLAVSCMFMWIILAALCFGAVFDGLGAVKAIEYFFVEKLDLGPWEILILMQLSYLVMGMFLDDTAMLVIVAPLYVPLVDHLGFDLVWYGVLYTITCQVAYMTPPFGYNLFLMRAMAPPEITLADIYRSITPFVLVMILGLVLVMIFPQIAMWLPNMYYAK